MLAVLTTTGDRPECFRLIERWFAAQTTKPDLWVVSDNGRVPITPTMGQTYTRTRDAGHNVGMMRNVLNALTQIPDGYDIAIMEDDDWYAPNHLALMKATLEQGDNAVGCDNILHYHVQGRCYYEASGMDWMIFANSAFSHRVKRTMIQVLEAHTKTGKKICKALWQTIDCKPPRLPRTVVGIKGMPGRTGISLKHNLVADRQRGVAWRPDPELEKLHEALGPDAEHYLRFIPTPRP